MTNHEHYDVLCTLAATGQLAGPEKNDLDEHCLHCTACRDQLRDLISIGVQLRLDAAMHVRPASMSAGSVARFRARSVREGIAPRSAPARSSTSYVMATVTAIFVTAVALVVMPHGRRASDYRATITAEQIPSTQNLAASVTARTLIPRPPRAVRTHSLRRVVPHTDMDVSDASLTAQRFSQAITASYTFWGPQSTTKSSVVEYPALSRAQMSRLDFLSKLDSNSRSIGGVATVRPVDIASTGNVFDFSAHIRELHFQVSSAQ